MMVMLCTFDLTYKSKKGRLMKIKKIILTTIALSTLLILSACSEDKKTQAIKKAPALAVQTITIHTQAVPIWKQYTGMTKASSDQEIRARVSGILEEKYFRDGEVVKKGQKLFKIEQTQYIAALNSAKAKKAQDEASLTLARADVKRYLPLVKEGLAPRATLEQYQAQEAKLKASILADNAEIRKAKLALSYTIVTAPISGKTSARRVDIGNLVGQGDSTLLTTIMNINPMFAYFSPSQSDVRTFQKYRDTNKPDAFITIKDNLELLRFDGFVDFSDNTVDPLTSTISMRATIPNPQGKILPGTFVYVNIFINDKYKFLMIPPQIIFNDQLGDYVYIVGENNKLKRVDIKTGYSTRFYVSVKSGLKDGDKVVISSLVKLKPNLEVKTMDSTKEKGIEAILKNNNLIPDMKQQTNKGK
jgi:RND family efflux transporter MFP subunit